MFFSCALLLEKGMKYRLHRESFGNFVISTITSESHVALSTSKSVPLNSPNCPPQNLYYPFSPQVMCPMYYCRCVFHFEVYFQFSSFPYAWCNLISGSQTRGHGFKHQMVPLIIFHKIEHSTQTVDLNLPH